MINKKKGNYVQTLLSNETITLLKKFQMLTGLSCSFILKTIIEIQLPKEVELFEKKMEVLNEKKTQRL